MVKRCHNNRTYIGKQRFSTCDTLLTLGLWKTNLWFMWLTHYAALCTNTSYSANEIINLFTIRKWSSVFIVSWYNIWHMTNSLLNVTIKILFKIVAMNIRASNWNIQYNWVDSYISYQRLDFVQNAVEKLIFLLLNLTWDLLPAHDTHRHDFTVVQANLVTAFFIIFFIFSLLILHSFPCFFCESRTTTELDFYSAN